ncbi:hypothetical protein ABEF95_014884 [Exophiala dermatitidis]
MALALSRRTLPVPQRLWQLHKPLIQRLYLISSLDEVRAIMEAEHNFVATPQQYKRMIAKWGVRKYVKADEMEKLLERPSANPVVRGNKVVSARQMRRFLRRKEAKRYRELSSSQRDSPPQSTCPVSSSCKPLGRAEVGSQATVVAHQDDSEAGTFQQNTLCIDTKCSALMRLAVKMVLNGHQSNIREYIGSLLGENGPWDKSTRSSFSGERILCLWLPESLIPPGCDDDLWPELVLPITPEELTSGFLTVKWETISLACFYLQFGSKVHYSGMTYGPVLDGLHLPPIVHAHALICAALVHAARYTQPNGPRPLSMKDALCTVKLFTPDSELLNSQYDEFVIELGLTAVNRLRFLFPLPRGRRHRWHSVLDRDITRYLRTTQGTSWPV